MQALPIFTKRLFHPSLITQSLSQSYPLDHGKKKNSRREKKYHQKPRVVSTVHSCTQVDYRQLTFKHGRK